MRTTRSLVTRALIAVLGAVAGFAAPAVQADVPSDGHSVATVEVAHVGHDGEAHATRAVDVARMASAAAPQILGWDTPTARSYYLTSSCQPWAGTIRQGAAAWNRLSEGGGTPVECRNSYITDCGGGATSSAATGARASASRCTWAASVTAPCSPHTSSGTTGTATRATSAAAGAAPPM